jgi:hypothetical protein
MSMGAMGRHDVIIFVQGATSTHGYCLFTHRNVTGTGYVALFEVRGETHLEEPYPYHPPVHPQEVFLG